MASDSKEELVAEYATLGQLAEELRRRIDLLNVSLNELTAAKSAVDELVNVKEGEEVLVPVGAGIYVKANISNTKIVLVSIGANIIVERSLEEAKKYLDDREQRVRDALQKTLGDYQAVVSRMRELERGIRTTSSK
ncbi:MAG: prefoldin subunit alpha [Thermofilaceae archaeon]